MGKGRKNKRQIDEDDQEINSRNRKLKIKKLRQLKATNKAGFTRLKNELIEMLHDEDHDRKKIKEVKKKLTSQHEKIMEILSELVVEYDDEDDHATQDELVAEMERVNEDFNYVIDSYDEVLRSTHHENSISSRSSVSQKKAETVREQFIAKQKELELQYKLKMDELQKEMHTELDKISIRSDKSEQEEKDRVANWVAKTVPEQNSPQSIGKDMWKQLKRVSIPKFDGDKKTYEAWKAAFTACIDQAPATGEYKLLQLRNYLSGEALKAIDGLGHSELAYEAAKERLERKFGGTRRKVLKYVADLDELRPIREDQPKDVERFADLLDIAIINLKEAGREEELGDGVFYHKLQKKLPEKMLARYKRWVHEQRQKEDVQSLKMFIIEEAEYQVAAAETLYGLQSKRKSNNSISNSFFGRKDWMNKKNNCVVCKETHRLWECQEFKKIDVSRRWEIAKENHICFRCLSGNHLAKACRNSRICGINGCTDTHNRLLHKKKEAPPTNTQEPEQKHEGEVIHNSHTAIQKKLEQQQYVSLRTVPVILKNGSRKVIVNALLDDGSTQTYVNSDVAAELGLEGWRKTITVAKLNGQEETLDTTPVEFELESIDGKVNVKIEAYTMERVTGRLKPINWSSLAKKWKHLKGIPFPSIGPKGIIDILIGVDYVGLHSAYEEIRGATNEPIARLTPLGWTCVGGGSGPLTSHFTISKYRDNDLINANETIKKLWEIEGEDIFLPQQVMTDDEAAAMKVASESLKYGDGRYEIKLPWKSDKTLENNYSMAVNRLKTTEKRLLKDKDLGKKYSEVIKQYIQKDYLEKIENVDNANDECWYLPHFPVIRPDKATTKVRIVFDGAAKFKGRSLNDVIHQGPKLQQDLIKVLLRFRRFPVALVCDIAEMYLRIGIHEDDRKFQRMLWRDLNTEEEPSVYQFKRMVFGINSSPFEAQFISQEHARRKQKVLPKAAESVLQSTYMDDTMDSVMSENEGKQLYKELTEMWNTAGMHARKWMSNSPSLLQEIPEEDRAEKIDLDAGELPAIKTLGIVWDARSDKFTYHSVYECTNITYTKRILLKKMATLFDPLGFLSPFIIRIKIAMQELWTKGLDWDDELPPECVGTVSKWFEELKDLKDVEVPRCLQLKSNVLERRIHVFTDASSEAYGAVIYQRSIYEDGEVSSRFVIAKSRVSPLKATSIPRLELLAAVLGLQLVKKVVEALQEDLSNVIFWSDSMNVLWWIRNQSRKLKPFVANRISLIQTSTAAQQWRYVPTKQNPADLLTRGSSLRELAKNTVWWNGPGYLTDSSEKWPANKFEPSSEATKEMKSVTTTLATRMMVLESNQIVDVNKYSSWTRMIRVIAWINRFVRNCKKIDIRKGELECDEIESAEYFVIAKCQEESFRNEYHALTNKNSIAPSSKISALSPWLDEEGIMRSCTRLQNASYLPYNTKYPIILPRNHRVTKLIVVKAHEDGYHVIGTNQMLSKLSERYWILRGREVIRQVQSDCKECKRRKAKITTQIMAPLPNIRLKEPLKAFARVGVDFAGPLITIQGRGKRRAKRYLCLFTCLLSRATHLEMAYSLDTDSFLNALHRMINRRGSPLEVLSDNGTNFVGGNNELQEFVKNLDTKKIVGSTATKGIKWHFNAPWGPHLGGVFETMIKSAKRAIFGILGNADVTDEELHTAITGAEGLLNSRPLTYQTADAKDDLPLTPNHFLHGQLGGEFAPDLKEEDYSPKKRWRRVQELVSHFWKRWMREWLPSLSPRSKWKKEGSDLKEGDVVMVITPDTPKGKWPLGRVTKVHPGRDGHVRVTTVKIGGKEYVRPISRLCPLEINCV